MATPTSPRKIEYPILFTGDMVRAILDGRKTQTRRVIKPQPDVHPWGAWHWGYNLYKGDKRRIRCGPRSIGAGSKVPVGETLREYCPWGQAGESTLWVRECYTVEPIDMMCCNHRIRYRADGAEREMRGIQYVEPGVFAIDGPGEAGDYPQEKYGVWRPSIHMFRWACRLFLEVTDVRVERVQDITAEDAEAEGCWRSHRADIVSVEPPEFRTLWDSMYTKRGYWNRWEDDDGVVHKEWIVGDFSWDRNPWVWKITFKLQGEER